MDFKRRCFLCIPLLLLLVDGASCYEETMGGSNLLRGRWVDGDDDDDWRLVIPMNAPRCPSPDPSLYNQPVIGIVSHPGDGASGRLRNSSGVSNIPASYVKFVESAGARVIPLIYNEPEEILLEKLNLVNGVLFTGGWAKKGLYYETIKSVFQKTLERNDDGDHFPLFAICLGFELVSMIISKDRDICERFRAENQASALYFPDFAEIQGSVFERFPRELLRKLSTGCLAMQNHKYGLSPKRVQDNDALSSFFRIVTTSKDESGKIYVSTVQAYNYPVTGFQWHPEYLSYPTLSHGAKVNEICWWKGRPGYTCGFFEIFINQDCLKVKDQVSLRKVLSEKNPFEWGLPMIPHSEDAVRVTQHVANYFISEARRSSNRPPVDKVLDNLIYNYSPTYCGKAGTGYDEVYIFS